ncbi:MAG TPA: hypothetical protein VGC42_18000 [Kofleriaceae bacterium]
MIEISDHAVTVLRFTASVRRKHAMFTVEWLWEYLSRQARRGSLDVVASPATRMPHRTVKRVQPTGV